MPAPEETRYEIVLTNISIKYRNEAYIADQIAPLVEVPQDTGRYPVYGEEHFMVHDFVKARGAEARQIDWSFTWQTYTLIRHSARYLMLDVDREAQVPGIVDEASVTEMITDMLLLEYENEVASLLTNPDNYNGNVLGLMPANYAAGPHQINWDDYDKGDPLATIAYVVGQIQKGSGRVPNTIVIPFEIAQVIANHPQVLEQTKYTNPELLTTSGIPRVFKGLKVLEAISNKQVEGKKEAVWGNNVIIAWVDPRPGLRKLSLAWTFTRRQAEREGWVRTIRRYRDEAKEGTFLEGSMTYSPRVVCAKAGFLISGVLAS